MSNSLLHRSTALAAGWLFCLGWMLFPLRPPNVEPILATTMALPSRFGPVAGLAFPALSIIFFDAITGNLTQWTIVTSMTYAAIGLGAWAFLRWRPGIVGYVAYAVIATLVFDAITGVAAGAVLFGMSWKEGFFGQIPFTINHLIGNVLLAVILTPLFERALRWTVPLPVPVRGIAQH